MAALKIGKSESFEITPELLEFNTGNDTRNIGIKHFLCLRQVLPKTRLSQVILYENVSSRRQLTMKLESLKKDRFRNAQVLDSNMRAFKKSQEKKQEKWRHLDEIRLSSMNLPCVHLSSESERPKSGTVMYRMNEFSPDGDKPVHPSPVLPNMHSTIRREHTEIITHREKTFMTKFPEIIEYDKALIDRHDRYCGKMLLEKGGSGRDARFQRFMTSLSPAVVDSEDYPVENLKTLSRLCRYAVPTDTNEQTPRSARFRSIPPKSHQQNLHREVAKRFEEIKSREPTFYSDIVDKTDEDEIPKPKKSTKKPQTCRYEKRGEYILETYKSDAVIYLNKRKRQIHSEIAEESPDEIHE